MAIVIPAPQLGALASLPGVLSVSANRPMVRSLSLVSQTTGAADLLARSSVGFDGRGVGIAVIDSGIAYQHRHFAQPLGGSRVRAAVDIRSRSASLEDGGWRLGIDASLGSVLRLDGPAVAASILTAAAPNAYLPDGNGHGTHVASMAAGRRLPAARCRRHRDRAPICTTSGCSTSNGVGTTADVLAGIDWVIQRARLLNIRVINLSLAADSTESYLTDPLARAARAATQTGIVVVVAGGNYGHRDGVGSYGTIGSPGHEPSVITVGAANPQSTRACAATIW